MRHISIPGEDESQWNEHPHWEWGCASPGMHILTGNAHSLYRMHLSRASFQNRSKRDISSNITFEQRQTNCIMHLYIWFVKF